MRAAAQDVEVSGNAPPRSGSGRAFPVVRGLLALSVAVLAVHLARSGGLLVDDAFISLRYARNLVEGHGLVFNPGERVEGYTNFLWTIFAAGAIGLGLPVVPFLQATSAALAAAALASVRRAARSARVRNGAAARHPGPAVWLLPLPAFAYWGTTALETMAFTALATGGFVLAAAETRDGRRRGSVLLFVLLGLTRPEGPYVFALVHAGLALAGLRSLGRLDLRRRLGDGAIFVALWGPWFAARWAWYGEPLPNTFHAKVTGGPEQVLGGLATVGSWTLHHPVLAVGIAAAGVLGWVETRPAREATPAQERERGRLLLAGAVVAVGWIAYVLAVGGDFMPWWRFLVPVLPLGALLLSLVLDRLLVRLPGVIVLAWIVHVLAPLPSEEPLRALVADRTTIVGLEVGQHLRAQLEPDALVALNTAGAVPWSSRLPTLDMLGLTDAEIARHPVYVVSPRWAGHRRGWGESVLRRRPRAVLWYNSAGLATPHYLGDRQLADSPRFRFFYQLRRDVLPAEPAAGTVLGRFVGDELGAGRSPELGLDAVIHASPTTWTEVLSAPIALHRFELRTDLEPLWSEWDRQPTLEAFLDAATLRFTKERPRSFDPRARSRVETLCTGALAAIEEGRLDDARPLLSEGTALARRAVSALPFQYVTNVAVLERNLPLAVQSQIEALRLEPGNALYRRNLHALLTVSWEQFGESR